MTKSAHPTRQKFVNAPDRPRDVLPTPLTSLLFDPPVGRRRLPGYTVRRPDEFDLGKLTSYNNLIRMWCHLEEFGGHGAGIDGLTFTDFSKSERSTLLRRLSSELLRQQYVPSPTREVQVPKGDGRYRSLSLQVLGDRVVAKALQIALDPYLRTFLQGIGRSTWDVYAQMQRAIRYRNEYVLAIDDIRDCFPSAQLDRVVETHQRHINQPDLLWLINCITRGHEDREGSGLEQGSPYSPPAMELLLHHHLDVEMENRYRGYPLLLRYVDNLTFLCRNEREGEEILRTTAEILAPTGFTLKGKDGNPQDIRDPQYDHVVLGMVPRWRSRQLIPIIPETAYEDLQQDLLQAHQTRNPDRSAKTILVGWIAAVGPALTNQVAATVVDRTVAIARGNGFRKMPFTEILLTAHRARKRWLALANSPERHVHRGRRA